MVLNSLIMQSVLIGLLLWVAVLTVFLVQSILHYQKLTKNITKKDLKSLLNNILDQLSLHQTNVDQLTHLVDQLTKNSRLHFQKTGFVRFNPFPQTGGDQSFCLSLLDAKDNGFVISSLHSRDHTRVYAKLIQAGKATDDFQLSKEEQKAIKNAK